MMARALNTGASNAVESSGNRRNISDTAPCGRGSLTRDAPKPTANGLLRYAMRTWLDLGVDRI
jgi:hypothetical protein